jgi:hypothetical protein
MMNLDEQLARIYQMMGLNEGVVKNWGSNERIHITSQADMKIQDLKDYTDQQNENNLKPVGFWYGFGDEWLNFLHKEDYFVMNNRRKNIDDKYRYKIKIDKTNIMVIDSIQKSDEFYEIFKGKMELSSIQFIDWEKVAQAYMGIEIPNINALRSGDYWMTRNKWWNYSSWDISSGCIWNPMAIQRIKLIGSL